MGEDGDSLGRSRGVRYRERAVALCDLAFSQGLVATEHELLTEHVAFLFGSIDLGLQGETV